MSFFVAIVYQHRGEVSAARERAGAALALCQEHGFPFYLPGSMIVQGWARVEQGEAEDGICVRSQPQDGQATRDYDPAERPLSGDQGV